MNVWSKQLCESQFLIWPSITSIMNIFFEEIIFKALIFKKISAKSDPERTQQKFQWQLTTRSVYFVKYFGRIFIEMYDCSCHKNSDMQRNLVSTIALNYISRLSNSEQNEINTFIKENYVSVKKGINFPYEKFIFKKFISLWKV